MDEIIFSNDNYRRQYRQTLQLGLIKVVQDLFPLEKLKIPYSILDGIYCELSNSLVSSREVKLIETNLKRWVCEKNPIEFVRIINHFYEYKLGETLIQSIHPAFENSSEIMNFELIHFPPGFILHFAEKHEGKQLPFLMPEKLSATYTESQRWLENINLDGVNDVNNYISYGRSLELISIAEALHEKRISRIADMIYEQKRAIKVVLISGPSSSGKTTFTQRLSTQLRVNGLKPVSISLDDYFLNREDTPKDASGQYDFDALEALDLSLLNRQLEKLIEGKIVEVPTFNLLTGKRSPKGRFLQLGKNEILLVEGIHALNPNLLSFEKKDHFFKIYLSALFLLNIDGLNRVPTTEARLIRRM
jgi:uridine kinase